MWMVALFACSSPPAGPTRPAKPAVAPVAEGPAPVPQPRLPERAAVVETLDAVPYGSEVEACEAPCDPAPLRAQASTEAREGERIRVAELAVDGDPATAWCGVGGVGERVSFALPALWDVRRVHLALTDVDGTAAWTKAKLTTDRRDHLTVDLVPPANAALGPAVLVDLDLSAVQFVQLEVLALAAEGRACIREVAIEGSPSVQRVEAGEAGGPAEGVDGDPEGDEPDGGGPVPP